MPKASPSSSQVSSAAYARIVEPLGHLDAARPCEPNQHRHGNGERGANGSDRSLAFPERKLPIVFLLWLYCTTCVVKSNHMLDLHSKARQRLLAYYFTNPTARHHLRDLAERLSIDPSNLSKELRRLEREGLFRSEVSGRQKYFQLNREYPLFDEVRSIVAKTIGAVALRKLERQLGREINYTVLTRKEFESRRARKDAFLENVWHNKRVSLVGAATRNISRRCVTGWCHTSGEHTVN